MAQILVLEDSDDSYEIIRRTLESGHDIKRATTISQAKRLFSSNFNLLILDVSLPDGDGYEFCNWVRTYHKKNVPIVFVSAKTSTESCITGFVSGGDDYIFKPFHPAEFLARVNAKLRFYEQAAGNIVESNDIQMDLISQKAYLIENMAKTELNLTPIEFKILYIFLNAPGKAIGRDEILDSVWGKEIYVYPRSVDTHVSNLRKKLGYKGDLISCVHGRGYRFSPMPLKVTIDNQLNFDLRQQSI